MTMDLNCDMGELEDARLEAALMEYVTSANIACGGHAGDEAAMERTARLAIARGERGSGVSRGSAHSWWIPGT